MNQETKRYIERKLFSLKEKNRKVNNHIDDMYRRIFFDRYKDDLSRIERDIKEMENLTKLIRKKL